MAIVYYQKYGDMVVMESAFGGYRRAFWYYGIDEAKAMFRIYAGFHRVKWIKADWLIGGMI